MGLFVFPKSDSKEDLIEHIEASLEMFSNHELSTHVLETAQDSLNRLIKFSKEKVQENDARNDAYFKKKKTYPLCQYCIHYRYRKTEEIDWEKGIHPTYCVEVDTEIFNSQVFRKFKDYDENGPCKHFIRKDNDE